MTWEQWFATINVKELKVAAHTEVGWAMDSELFCLYEFLTSEGCKINILDGRSTKVLFSHIRL